MNLEKRPQGIQDAAAEKGYQAEKAYQKELLDIVFGVAGDNVEMINEGIVKALRGENDRARRTYLWNVLSKAAAAKIRSARRKFSVA